LILLFKKAYTKGGTRAYITFFYPARVRYEKRGMPGTMNYLGILASGNGTRMGIKLPKQYLMVGDCPVVIRVVRTFLRAKDGYKVVIAVSPDWKDYLKDLLVEYGADLGRIILTEGGATRFLSMARIVEACAADLGESLSDDDMLLVHDCARLFVSQRIINDNFAMAREFDMVTTSIPTTDTVLIARNGRESDLVPDRSTVFLDQGPQTFRIKQFLSIYEKLTQEQMASYIEAGRMYLEHGLSVGIVKGEQTNFKITTEFDLLLARTMLEQDLVR